MMTSEPPPHGHWSWHLRRQEMVDRQLRRRGIRDQRVLGVMEEIPRERFLPEGRRGLAYEDRAVPIDANQTISQPYIVAFMSEQLGLESTSRVLEIGSGSGYQTAILARLVQRVFTVERIRPLLEQARARVEGLGLRNVSYRLGDGTLGWPEEAPFDRILVTAGTPRIPDALLDQLGDDGRLVAPVGGDREQHLVRIDRRIGRDVTSQLIPCRFVKLIGEDGWADEGSV